MTRRDVLLGLAEKAARLRREAKALRLDNNISPDSYIKIAQAEALLTEARLNLEEISKKVEMTEEATLGNNQGGDSSSQNQS